MMRVCHEGCVYDLAHCIKMVDTQVVVEAAVTLLDAAGPRIEARSIWPPSDAERIGR